MPLSAVPTVATAVPPQREELSAREEDVLRLLAQAVVHAFRSGLVPCIPER